jgi:hypothetical protein
VAAHHPEVELISAGSFMYDLIRGLSANGTGRFRLVADDEAIDPEARSTRLFRDSPDAH